MKGEQFDVTLVFINLNVTVEESIKEPPNKPPHTSLNKVIVVTFFFFLPFNIELMEKRVRRETQTMKQEEK